MCRSRTRGCRSRVTSGCGRRSPTTSPRGTGTCTTRAREIVVTCGGCEAVLDILLATIDPGDEVVLTDPIYAGLVNRVRLAGGVPVFAPLAVVDGEWRLDRDALAAAISPRTVALLMMSPSMPSGCVLYARGLGGGRAAVQRARPLPAVRRRDGGARLRRPRAVRAAGARGHGRAHRDRGFDVQGVPDDRLARGLDRRAGLGGQRRGLGARVQHDRRGVRGPAGRRGGAARAAGARGVVCGRVAAPARHDPLPRCRSGRS